MKEEIHGNETKPDLPAPESVASAPVVEQGGLDAGKAFIQEIVAEPPAPVPGLAEKLKAESGAAETPETGMEADCGGCPETIRVNPEDWKHLKDYQGRSFDPNIHKVNLDGSPVIGTKDRLQRLKKKETNPVKVILSRFSSNEFADEVEIETQDEAHAQAQAVVDRGRLDRKANRVVNFWFWGGSILWGLGFRKNRKERSGALVDATTDYMLETGKEIDVPPGLNAFGAFVADFEEMLWLNVGENPKDGAVKKFLLRRLPMIRWAFRMRRKAPETPQQEKEGEYDATA